MMSESNPIKGEHTESQLESVKRLVEAHEDGDAIAIETAYANARDNGMSDLEIAQMLLVLDQQKGNGVLLSPGISRTFEDIQKRVGATLES